jgi:AraC-like DNA-binding protein
MHERIEWAAPAELPGVMVLLADNCARRWRIFHETYSICTGLAISKPAGWRYRGKTHYQPADGVSLMEPGEVHANTEITRPASFRVLQVDAAAMTGAADSLGLPARPHLRVAQLQGGPIHKAFVALHRALEEPSTRLERQTRFDAAMRMMLMHCAETPPRAARAYAPAPAVQRARAYIHEHLTEDVTLDELVRAAGAISRFQLVRAFKARYGLPPHAYQIHLRISQAARLVSLGIRLAEVAATHGFADQAHFSRHFRRIMRVTPGQYARSTGRRREIKRV